MALPRSEGCAMSTRDVGAIGVEDAGTFCPGPARSVDRRLASGRWWTMSTHKLATPTPTLPQDRHHRALTLLLLRLEIFVRLGAVYGGAAMLRDPLNPMGAKPTRS